MGLVASYFSKTSAMLGLEFTFNFRKPVRPGDTLVLNWEVVAVTPKASLDGEIVSLAGSIINQEGVEVLASTGKVLVTARL
jgi:acyl dehydratase